MIGTDYSKPKVRLPGSGGANDLASFCWQTLILMKHDAKKFVPELDFLTTPGYLTGPGAREAAGLPANTGPHRVITDLAVLDFEPISKRMRLLSIHPWKSLEDVQKATGFELLVSESLGTTAVPSDSELNVLRTQVDPGRYILGRAG